MLVIVARDSARARAMPRRSPLTSVQSSPISVNMFGDRLRSDCANRT
jgi:hypothetical protein